MNSMPEEVPTSRGNCSPDARLPILHVCDGPAPMAKDGVEAVNSTRNKVSESAYQSQHCMSYQNSVEKCEGVKSTLTADAGSTDHKGVDSPMNQRVLLQSGSADMHTTDVSPANSGHEDMLRTRAETGKQAKRIVLLLNVEVNEVTIHKLNESGLRVRQCTRFGTEPGGISPAVEPEDGEETDELLYSLRNYKSFEEHQQGAEDLLRRDRGAGWLRWYSTRQELDESCGGVATMSKIGVVANTG